MLRKSKGESQAGNNPMIKTCDTNGKGTSSCTLCRKSIIDTINLNMQRTELAASSAKELSLSHIENVDIKIEGIKREMFLVGESLKKDTATLEYRLEGLNQLRQDVTRDRDQFVPRGSFDVQHSAHEQRIKEIGSIQQTVLNRLAILETKIYTVVGVVGFLLAILEVIMHFWGK
jgi:predicted aspartyl protease